jgi:uncharacterized iron-regulated membrane protein
MAIRWAILKVHLLAGISAAAFLAVLGLTGCLLAFQDSYDGWLHPSLWRVAPRDFAMSEQALIDLVEERFAPARVESIRIKGPSLAQVFVFVNRTQVFVDPYSGAVLGVREEAPAWAKAMALVRQIHVQLASGRTGRWLIDAATIEILVLIPTGFVLWWKKKRLKIDRKAPWSRLKWDLHNVIGAYAGLFLLIASVTGFFIAFEPQLYWATRTSPHRGGPMPHSTPPPDAMTSNNSDSTNEATGLTPRDGERPRPNVDDVLTVADQALPGLATVAVGLPKDRRAPYTIEKRVPQWMSGGAPSKVFVDQYSHSVLRIDDVRSFASGFRLYYINQSLHTGEILGMPSKIVMSVASLLLSILAFTGVMIGWRKLVTDVSAVGLWLAGKRKTQKALLADVPARNLMP